MIIFFIFLINYFSANELNSLCIITIQKNKYVLTNPNAKF
jgi:hypothetical protein